MRLRQLVAAEGKLLHRCKVLPLALLDGVERCGLAESADGRERRQQAVFRDDKLSRVAAVDVDGLKMETAQAEFIADKLLCESRCVTPLRILAPVIPLSAIHGCLQGYYLGQKKASLPAISQILEQAARIGSVILLYRIFIQESRAITPSLAVLGLLFG